MEYHVSGGEIQESQAHRFTNLQNASQRLLTDFVGSK